MIQNRTTRENLRMNRQAAPLDTLVGMPYYQFMMSTRTIHDYQNWYHFSFTPPALLVGRSVLIR